MWPYWAPVSVPSVMEFARSYKKRHDVFSFFLFTVHDRAYCILHNTWKILCIFLRILTQTAWCLPTIDNWGLEHVPHIDQFLNNLYSHLNYSLHSFFIYILHHFTKIKQARPIWILLPLFPFATAPSAFSAEYACVWHRYTCTPSISNYMMF
jgi:hypothetical protein